jgi:hypothetical protein
VVRASRVLGDRSDTSVGPFRVEVVKPLVSVRFILEPNEHGIACDLIWNGAIPAFEEPRQYIRKHGRVLFDTMRFAQTGCWSGTLEVGGERIAVTPDRWWGTRDRSWGVRPVGERPPGAPVVFNQFYWLWSPVNFDDGCLHFDVNEYADGHRWHESGFIVPLADAEPEMAVRAEYALRWEPGTRHMRSFDLTLHRHAADPVTARFEPIFHFQMLGIGYGHPEWRHGSDKGAAAVGGQRWSLPLADPVSPQHVHVQTLCRVTRGDGAVGTGILETMALGPHAPTGLTGALTGAPA